MGSDLCKGIERQVTEHIQERLEGQEHSRRLQMKFKVVVYICVIQCSSYWPQVATEHWKYG